MDTDLILRAHVAMHGEITKSLRFICGKYNNNTLSLIFNYSELASSYDFSCASTISTEMLSHYPNDTKLEENIFKSNHASWREHLGFTLIFLMNENQ